MKRVSKYPVELCKVLDWLPKVWIHLNKVWRFFCGLPELIRDWENAILGFEKCSFWVLEFPLWVLGILILGIRVPEYSDHAHICFSSQGSRPISAYAFFLFQYLEVINSSEASVGPAQFMDCPLDVTQSRQWFIRLWNDSLAIYVREKASEGLHLYQKRASLEDPYEFVSQTWPWTSGESPETALIRIESESQSGTMHFDGLSGGYRRNESLLSDAEDPNDPDPLVRESFGSDFAVFTASDFFS